MRGLFSLLFILFLRPVFSQNAISPFIDTSNYQHELIFQGKGDIYSSSLQNTFIDKVLFGGTITNPEITNALSKQQNNNTLGIEANSEIEYRNYALFPNKKWGILFKTSANTINSCHYTKDLFGVLFQGNENYLGKPISLNSSSIQSISYFKFGIGLVHKKTKSNFSLNFFRISNYINSTIDFGSIYVNDSSNLALINLKGSSTSYIPTTSQTNYGIGIDFDIKIPLTIFSNKRIYLNLIAKNFGIGILTNEVRYYYVDTNYNFQGLTINQLNTLINEKQQNILQQLTIHSSNKIRYTPLLGYIQLDKMTSLDRNSKYQSIYGIRMYPSLSLIPYVYGGIQIKFFEKIWLGIHENYGITNTFRTGLFFKLISSKLGVSVGTENLIDSFRLTGKGRSFQCRLQWHI